MAGVWAAAYLIFGLMKYGVAHEMWHHLWYVKSKLPPLPRQAPKADPGICFFFFKIVLMSGLWAVFCVECPAPQLLQFI